jgi:hypothetical protein
MIEYNSGHRFFSYSVSGLQNPTGEVIPYGFYDSTGQRIKCNFVKIELHYDGKHELNHAQAYIELSGISQGKIEDGSLPVKDYTAADVSSGNVSGLCGDIITANINQHMPFIWKADNEALVDGVNIAIVEYIHSGVAADDIYVYVTYGNVVPYNVIRQERFDRGL